MVVLRTDTGMNDLDAAFAALADPTRRKVLTLLAQRDLRAGEIAQQLKLAAPATSKHLKVLRESLLVEIDSDAGDARAKVYRLRNDGFRAMNGWLHGVDRFWEEQVQGFKSFAEKRK